jgi:hypothetical protein
MFSLGIQIPRHRNAKPCCQTEFIHIDVLDDPASWGHWACFRTSSDGLSS